MKDTAPDRRSHPLILEAEQAVVVLLKSCSSETARGIATVVAAGTAVAYLCTPSWL